MHPGGRALLVLADTRVAWRERIQRWSSTGPATFLPSAAHVRAVVRRGARRAVLIDGSRSDADRDLLLDVVDAGSLAVVVDDGRRLDDWARMGATAVLPRDFDEQQLHAAVNRGTLPAVRSSTDVVDRGPWGPLVAVTGPGGTGASVVAIATAQGLATSGGRVLLADCCLHAEQGMLHDVHNAQPGLADLVALHADATPGVRQVRQLVVGVVERGYHLLPGLRRSRHWSTVGPASFRTALASLRMAFDAVVADVDADVEGEADGGSLDVEERNRLSREVLGSADVVLVVGQPSMKGVYALVRTMIDLLEFDLRPDRMLPVVNQAPTAPGARAGLGRAVQGLLAGATSGAAVGPVLFLPAVPVDPYLCARDPLPGPLPSLLAGAVGAVLARGDEADGRRLEPERVGTGVLGHWPGERP